MVKSYGKRLNNAVISRKTPALVGIDPRFDDLPGDMKKSAGTFTGADHAARATAFQDFSCRIIDVVAPLVAAVKPQAAFFEELGPPGMEALQNVIRYARERELIVICDAKRGDIGSTAEAYARGFLAGENPAAAPWSADALTVNAYAGLDTLQPFVDLAIARGAGVYVLVRTSNKGAGTLQDHGSGSTRLFEHLAALVERLAGESSDESGYGPVGAVVGATWPTELAELRKSMPHAPLLVPGYGSQGAGAADVASAFKENGLGALVNSSRGINFAWQREPYLSKYGESKWEQAVEAATRDMIDDLAAHTPASALRRGC